MITQKELKKFLSYDPLTGEFTWLIHNRISKHIGTIAGKPDNYGYIIISINNNRYKAHRLAWLYMTGKWPKDMIDHIDCNPSNNTFSNLREASNAENQSNSKLSKRNSSGIKGVRWDKKRNKWSVSIAANKIRYYIGSFDSIQEAIEAVKIARQNKHKQFARIK